MIAKEPPFQYHLIPVNCQNISHTILVAGVEQAARYRYVYSFNAIELQVSSRSKLFDAIKGLISHTSSALIVLRQNHGSDLYHFWRSIPQTNHWEPYQLAVVDLRVSPHSTVSTQDSTRHWTCFPGFEKQPIECVMPSHIYNPRPFLNLEKNQHPFKEKSSHDRVGCIKESLAQCGFLEKTPPVVLCIICKSVPGSRLNVPVFEKKHSQRCPNSTIRVRTSFADRNLTHKHTGQKSGFCLRQTATGICRYRHKCSILLEGSQNVALIVPTPPASFRAVISRRAPSCITRARAFRSNSCFFSVSTFATRLELT